MVASDLSQAFTHIRGHAATTRTKFHISMAYQTVYKNKTKVFQQEQYQYYDKSRDILMKQFSK